MLCCVTAADRVLLRRVHSIDDEVEVEVSRYQPPQPPSPTPPNPPTQTPPQPPQAIKVVDYTGKESMLELYFANKKKSNGGDVKSVEKCRDFFIVTFEEAEGKYILTAFHYTRLF